MNNRISCVIQRHWRAGATVLVLAQLLSVIPVGEVLAAGENNVHLYGALVAEPCVIPAGDEEIQLNFGGIVDKYLYQNTRTPGQAFSIHLADCDLTLGGAVKMTFMGTENSALPGLLAVDSGSAKGIAIGLETADAKAVKINQVSDKYPLREGDNVIPFRAYVQGEPMALTNQSIEHGTFNATATFSLEYE
ncbi:fimbrial protein [Serratia marcescens]|uniref:fimbrial protein n=1 Tax=Serratia marcescens TaxID=615 RepID=UPI003989396E